MRKPVVLCILDGWGISNVETGNAPLLARTPNFDQLLETCPNATLVTHGPDVGLPEGQMGNSEVGHTNIGAGRIVPMDLGIIDAAVADHSFASQEPIISFSSRLKSQGGKAHLIGIISDGGVHGQLTHMIAAAKTFADQNIETVIHAITDGRDVAPVSALSFLEDLQLQLPPNVKIATISGRYFALDRDNRWDRVQKAFDVMVHAKGPKTSTASAAIKNAYDIEVIDEFIPPCVIGGYNGMSQNDGIFCLNFRADRAREIMAAIAEPNFDAFETGVRPEFKNVLGMVSYSEAHDTFMGIAFPKRDLVNTLGEWVAKHGKSQFRLAETEKYPHVTFFLNGGQEVPAEGEDRFMPPSPKVATYDLQPQMSAPEVTEKFIAAIEKGYDLIVTNYANPDMVGHTGDLSAAIKACEAVDTGLGRIIKALEAAGGAMIVTADHGNCEVMIDPETGDPHTAHTTNLVPVILVNGPGGKTLSSGRLADLAPTLLELMEMPQPNEMTGKSLIL